MKIFFLTFFTSFMLLKVCIHTSGQIEMYQRLVLYLYLIVHGSIRPSYSSVSRLAFGFDHGGGSSGWCWTTFFGSRWGGPPWTSNWGGPSSSLSFYSEAHLWGCTGVKRRGGGGGFIWIFLFDYLLENRLHVQLLLKNTYFRPRWLKSQEAPICDQ